MASVQYQLSGAVICGPGQVRTKNQDNYYLNGKFNDDPLYAGVQRRADRANGSGLYAVADGMGGEKLGEAASWFAVRSLQELPAAVSGLDLIAYLERRNGEICALMRSNGGVRIGTTFVGLSIQDDLARIINIGDSRAYLFRQGQMRQVSCDHTTAQQMVDMGVLTREEADKHPHRHALTQHLGIFPEELLIEPYTKEGHIAPGDIFLLCSDGLFEMVSDAQILETLSGSGDVKAKAEALFARAMEGGGRDNITVMLISVEPPEGETSLR